MRSTTLLSTLWVATLVILGTTGIAPAAQEPVDAPTAPSPNQLPFELPERPVEGAGSSSTLPPAASLAAASQPPPALPSGGAAQAASGIREDIRDIRGPLPIAPSWRWAWFTLAGLIELGLVALLWHRLRRRSVVRARRAYQIAFDQLERAKALMQPEQARAYSFLVSETIREYIDQRFSVGITHSTTQEFMRSLSDGPPPPLQAHSRGLQEFLEHCDLAKFARWSLAVEQMQAMHESAWRFVEDTRPQPEKSRKQRRSAHRSRMRVPKPIPALAAAGGAS